MKSTLAQSAATAIDAHQKGPPSISKGTSSFNGVSKGASTQNLQVPAKTKEAAN
jgi:hypothetical protein